MKEELDKIKEKIATGKADEAIRLLGKLLAARPERREAASAYYLLGNAHRKRGDWQQALNNYQEAIELDPDSPAAEARRMMMDILEF